MIKEKLKEIRERTGMNKKEFAEYIGIKYTTYNNYETGAREPSSDFLILISSKFDVSIDYILGLQEDREILRSYELKSLEYTHIEKYRSLTPAAQSHVDSVLDWEVEHRDQLLEAQGQIDSLKLQHSRERTINRLLSYYGRIAAAGKSFGFEDMICGTIEVPLTDENRHADFAIGVSGDSMEPDFTGEDIVYVQKATQLDKGEIGIFQKDNCIYIKKVGNGELISLNPEYDPIPGEDVKLLGRVLGKIEGDYRIIK